MSWGVSSGGFGGTQDFVVDLPHHLVRCAGWCFGGGMTLCHDRLPRLATCPGLLWKDLVETGWKLRFPMRDEEGKDLHG